MTNQISELNVPFAVGNEITQGWGENVDFYKHSFKYGHNGFDIIPKGGRWADFEVLAVDDGEIVRVAVGAYAGNWVSIWNKEENRAFRYYHLGKIYVKEGDTVKRGQPIGFMGKTGNAFGYHLHLGYFLTNEQGHRLNTNNGMNGAVDPSDILRELNTHTIPIADESKPEETPDFWLAKRVGTFQDIHFEMQKDGIVKEKWWDYKHKMFELNGENRMVQIGEKIFLKKNANYVNDGGNVKSIIPIEDLSKTLEKIEEIEEVNRQIIEGNLEITKEKIEEVKASDISREVELANVEQIANELVNDIKVAKKAYNKTLPILTRLMKVLKNLFKQMKTPVGLIRITQIILYAMAGLNFIPPTTASVLSGTLEAVNQVDIASAVATIDYTQSGVVASFGSVIGALILEPIKKALAKTKKK